MIQAVSAPTTNALTVADLNTEVNCEPRMLDTRLAEALGFKDPHKIRPLIRRHLALLRRRGAISATVAENAGRGRPGKAFWLNRKQALLVCMKSETPRADEIVIQVIDVYDEATSGKTVKVQERRRRKPAPALTEAQPKVPTPDVTAPSGYTAGQGLFGLFGCACSTVAEWKQAGIVTDPDRAMYIALQAVFDVAGVDADVGRVAGLKRR